TAQHPYGAEQAHLVVKRILQDVPKSVSEIDPRLSPFFDEVVHTLLAKEPARRFQTATELAQVLAEGEKSVWWKDRAQDARARARLRRPSWRGQVARETPLVGREREMGGLAAAFEK